ncbi:MAG: urea carboxylase-associated family protein [Proteobacteria bacterium]|nr:urea carboxylase-associated family protein [Pseudomonadota bacterium]
METITVPARKGHAVHVAAGQTIRIITPKGQQAADFFAFNAADIGEWLSAPHTWSTSHHTKPRQGDLFLSRYRNPMLDFTEDGANGVHDMMLAACDRVRYVQLGHPEPHDGCGDNMKNAMKALGHEVDVVPQPVNFFTNTQVDADGVLTAPPNPVAPGEYVLLTARIDLICAFSACPFDMPTEDWEVNARGGPTELIVEIA